MRLDRRDLGTQPRSEAMRQLLCSAVIPREPKEVIVIHHYADKITHLQLEVERRSETLGIAFERLILT
jgi:hypothetical protein